MEENLSGMDCYRAATRRDFLKNPEDPHTAIAFAKMINRTSIFEEKKDQDEDEIVRVIGAYTAAIRKKDRQEALKYVTSYYLKSAYFDPDFDFEIDDPDTNLESFDPVMIGGFGDFKIYKVEHRFFHFFGRFFHFFHRENNEWKFYYSVCDRLEFYNSDGVWMTNIFDYGSEQTSDKSLDWVLDTVLFKIFPT